MTDHLISWLGFRAVEGVWQYNLSAQLTSVNVNMNNMMDLDPNNMPTDALQKLLTT